MNRDVTLEVVPLVAAPEQQESLHRTEPEAEVRRERDRDVDVEDPLRDALTAYFCFGLGAVKALLLLWRGEERYDLESYVAIHQGTIFGALTLITGSIWARASWGVWWTWSSNQLVLFLVLFLFYCAYFMLRFSLEDGPRRGRSSAVYALFGVALIPVSFLAIRLAEDFIHPTVFTREGPQMTGSMFTTFVVAWGAITLLAYVLYRVELAGKRLDADLRELREALE